MNPRGLILAGVTAAAMLVSGGVIASALNDLPQDAVPVQARRPILIDSRHHPALRPLKRHLLRPKPRRRTPPSRS